jgi:hypothetical protein
MRKYKNISDVHEGDFIQLLDPPFNALAGNGHDLNEKPRGACVVVAEAEGFFAELDPFYGGDSIREIWINDIDSVRLISRG